MNDKQSLLQALDETHQCLSQLILDISGHQTVFPYHPGINPPIWEWGHTAFFFEFFILRNKDQISPIMPGMDPIWDSFDIDHHDRWKPGMVPSLEQTQAYVQDVYHRIRHRIEINPLLSDDLYLYKYAIFHQHMHIESLIWCRQTLGYPAPKSVNLDGQYNLKKYNQQDVQIPGGEYRIGQPAGRPDFAGQHFSFDAEKPGVIIHLNPFSISRTLVSKGEFIDFMNDDGYSRPELWSFGGKKWLQALRQKDNDMTRPNQQQDGPIYWKKKQGEWQERYFDQWYPINYSAPITHISYWEAEAWCHWAGRRLPTEYEWEAAALGNRKGESFHDFPWGDEMDATRVDMDCRLMATGLVTDFETGQSPFGLLQCIGTVWEWTSSQFLPYPGFTMDMYPFMSTLQFGYHKVTKGGSCATSSRLIRGTYRQAYLPFRRDAFTGFRTCTTE
jgi:iron(II)-dependent oxidoreductase